VAGQTSAINFANVTAPMLRGPDSNREMILLKVAPSGSWVKKGDLIAEIDAQSMVDHVEDLGDTIETAQADIRKRRAEQSIELENLLQSVRQAKADLDKAQLDYGASETLTDIQRQLLKLTLEESQARYKQLQADIAEKKAAQAAEIKILEYTLLRHTRHRDRHARDVTAFTLRASMDGLVVMQQIWRGGEMGQVQQGDRLFPGQPFMKIVNTRSMQVEANLNQAESSDFRVGQPARIRLDAFNDLQFEGKVHSLGALAAGGWRNSYYVRTVPIRIAIQGNDPRLIPDLSASADVVIESAANQTIVPLAALKNEGGKHVVHVKSGDGFERREVTPGISSDTHVAVASGLQAGEVVRLD
jgi:multidrug efflux pump subunit AcrA (membrane-fusion protein)